MTRRCRSTLLAACFVLGCGVAATAFASAPTTSTSAATLVTSGSATLNGSADPGGEDTTGWFRYSTTEPVSCDDTFGTRAPASGGTDLGTGTSSTPFSEPIADLTPATTYYYCAIASNGSGTSFGTVQTFTTDTAPAPDVTTSAASSVTTTGATLNGSADPNGDSTTGWFRYGTSDPGTCNDTFGTRAPASGGSSLGSGSSSTPFSQAITGLSPGTTYYVCAIASNTVGTSFGSVQSFTTDSAPDVTTSAATSVTTTGATLNGSANPNGDDTTGWFRYSTVSPGTCNDTFGTRAPASGGDALGSGSSPVDYSRGITGLSPGTTYYVCAIASNTVGTSFGEVQSFTTDAVAPTVTTSAATLITGSGAQLNGAANPGGDGTTGWFRYSTVSPGTCNDTFGTRAPASGGSNLGSGTSSTPFFEGITGLSPGTTYYFCAIASNTVDTSFGAVQSFTTDAAPDVTTSAATSVTTTGATLNGSADPNGDGTIGWFRYSTVSPGACNDTFGTRAPASGGSALGSGSSPVTYSTALTGLTPGTTYYFCAIASNTVGTSFGEVQSFTATAAAPTVTTSPATLVNGSGARLNGAADPNGDSTTGWFRYSTTDPGSCDDSFGTRAPASGGTALGSGSSSTPFFQAIAGLATGTTYYFCAIGSNSGGTSFGSVQSFTTAAPPVVTTSAATSVALTSATLNGAANPGRATTLGWFRYGTVNPGTCSHTFGTRAPATSGTNIGFGSSPVSYSRAITGLTAGKTYYFCAVAQNSIGNQFGEVRSFTTPTAKPSVTTSAPTSVTTTTAQLNGAGNANGKSATGWFRYSTVSPGSCRDNFGTRAPGSGAASLGSGLFGYARAITGLAPGTTYYVCAIAQNSRGTSFGALRSFTTAAPPPDITPPGVTLGGKLRQKVGRRVRLKVTTTEDAGVRASGKVVIGSKTFALKRIKTRQVAEDVTTTFALVVPARTLAAIKAALSSHKRVTAKITVVAHDAAGNPTTKRRKVKIIR